jgi:ArsR family transcriptional regulator
MAARRRTAKKTRSALDGAALSAVAKRFRVLGDEQRLRILQALMAGERSVSELVEICDCSQGNVSTHLRLLREAGLVSARAAGTQRFYEISDPTLFAVCEIVCGSIDDQLEDSLTRFREGRG